MPTPLELDGGSPDVQPERLYDPEPRRDWVRAGITVLLVVTFIGIIAFALYATRGDKDVFDRPQR